VRGLSIVLTSAMFAVATAPASADKKRPKTEPFTFIKKVDKASARSAGKKSKFNDFHFVRKVDKASPVLAKRTKYERPSAPPGTDSKDFDRSSDGKPTRPPLTSPGLLDASGGGNSGNGVAAAGAPTAPRAPAGQIIR
jgi:hypothetical protein